MAQKGKTLAEAIAKEFHNEYGTGIGTYKKRWNELDEAGKWATLTEARKISAGMVTEQRQYDDRRVQELQEKCDKLKSALDVANNKLEYGAAPNIYLDVTYTTIDADREDDGEEYPEVTVQERIAAKNYYFGDKFEGYCREYVLYYVDNQFMSQEITQISRLALVLPNGEQQVIFEDCDGVEQPGAVDAE